MASLTEIQRAEQDIRNVSVGKKVKSVEANDRGVCMIFEDGSEMSFGPTKPGYLDVKVKWVQEKSHSL